MKSSILALLTIILVLSGADECFGNDARKRREVLKIKIIDKDDDDPKVSATIIDKPPDQFPQRRAFTVPYRRIYRPPVNKPPYLLNNPYNPYQRNGMYHTSTVYSPGELSQSLGSLVNSILMSGAKYPVNKIYIFSRNNPDLPHSEPVYHMYQQRGESEHKFIPSVQIQPSEIVIRPAMQTPEYKPPMPSIISRRPVAVPTLGADYHLPKVTETVEDMVAETPVNYAQELKNMHKSMKQLSFKPIFPPTSPPKKPIVVNEKVKAYTSFMKRPEYFLPKVEPDHHTEASTYYFNSLGQHQPQHKYESQPTPVAQALHYKPSRRQSNLQHHAFTTQNFEFTASDAIRTHPPPPTSSEEDTRYRVYESDNVSDNSYSSANAKSVAALSKQSFSTQDAIRLLESKRYTVPRDCSSRCLEHNRKNYDPVCGSDLRTYLNEEMLICLTTCRKTDTEMDYQGPCN